MRREVETGCWCHLGRGSSWGRGALHFHPRPPHLRLCGADALRGTSSVHRASVRWARGRRASRQAERKHAAPGQLPEACPTGSTESGPRGEGEGPPTATGGQDGARPSQAEDTGGTKARGPQRLRSWGLGTFQGLRRRKAWREVTDPVCSPRV